MDQLVDSALAGIPVDQGVKLLREAETDLWWFARSMYLCAGCDAAVPWLGFQPAGEPDRPTDPADCSRTVFGFRRDAAMDAWAARHRAAIAMPEAWLSARLGDKLYLPELAARAGVRVPRSVICRAVSHRDAGVIWRRLGAGRAVAQLAANDLTGAGTRHIGDAGELAACLGDWSGQDVKLAEYVPGIPLTVSGVVTAASVVVSGISYQLVGYQAVTPRWSAHCGNQLVHDALLPPDTARSCRQTCHRVGVVLAAAGFRGMYGMDVIAADNGVVLIELNPRVQSVTSLLNAAELGAGLLPSPLLHVLSFLGQQTVDLTGAAAAPPPFGQLVVASAVGGYVREIPQAGVYRLSEADPPGCTRVGSGAPLGTLGPGQALVWPMIARSARAEPADRLYVIQLPEPVAAYPGGALTRCATNWLRALGSCSRIEGAPA